MNDYPALTGEVVTERHARICAERGHASHTVNGRDSGTCPRCGTVTESYDTSAVVELPDSSESEARGLNEGWSTMDYLHVYGTAGNPYSDDTAERRALELYPESDESRSAFVAGWKVGAEHWEDGLYPDGTPFNLTDHLPDVDPTPSKAR